MTVLVAALASAVVLLAPVSSALAAPTIATSVGTGVPAFSGDGGSASAAQVSTPVDVTAIPAGGYYIADQGNQRIRKVDTNGQITTVAGNGVQGYAGDNGPATSAALNAPSAVAILPDGSLLIADANNNAIRKVATNGIITTVAGKGPGFPGFSGDGGPATSATLRFPYDLAVYTDGSYLIADSDNARIRKVSPTGVISTVAGGGGSFGDGGPALSAQLAQPKGLALTPSGGYLIGDPVQQRVREVSATGTITTAAGTGIAGSSGDGGLATAARLNGPHHIQYNAGDGYFLIADRLNSKIRKVTVADGKISTLTGDGTAGYAGDGGPPEGGRLNVPIGMDIANDQAVLIADSGNHRVRRVFSGTQPPGGGGGGPPKNPAVNLRAPAISDVFITKTVPRYLCDAGLWQNISGGFSYSWYRLDRPVSIFKTLATTTKVATTVTYDLPAADKGKEFYCEVSAVGDDGRRVTVASPRRVLTGQKSAISLFTTKTYGNVQVRGIDVFQTVQPDAQTQTFGWDRRTFFGLCGGGTPTVFSPGPSNPTAPCGSAPVAGGVLPVTPQQLSSDPQSVTYNGVEIDAQKDATAIVYVNTTDGPPADPNAKLLLRLRGLVKDKPLPDQVTTTISGIRERSERWVDASERANPASAFRVRIPWSWLDAAARTSGGYGLELEASVSISIADTGFQECATGSIAPTLGQPAPCAKDNTFRLGFIPVRDDLPNLVLRTLPLVGSKQRGTRGPPLQGPNSTLKVVTDLFPGGNRFRIEPFSVPVDITSADRLTIDDKYCEAFRAKKDVPGSTDDLRGCKMAKVGSLVNTWLAADQANRTGYDALVGIHDYNANGGDEPGWKPGGAELRQTDRVPRLFVNDGSLKRPFTAAAHEFGHLLSAPHADQAPQDPVSKIADPVSGSGCGGNSNGQVGEAWPPGNFGRLQGYAFGFYDGMTGSTRGTDVQRDNPATTNPNFALWDFMSYCAPENRAWISAKNWQRYFDELQFLNKRGRPTFKHQAAATASGQAFVVGSVGPGGAVIDRVVPASPGNGVPASVAGSSLQITALGPGGRPLGTTGADVQFLEDGPAGVGSFTAPLPAGAVAVEAREGGRTLARVQRTTPPKVALTAPRRGARVKGGKRSQLVVAWKTTDPDSSDRLARVEYAANGRSFRTVWQGKDTGRVALAGSSLAAATKARVRVVVNDGFTDGSGVSAPFRADGAPPAVTITSPGAGERLSTGVRALLKGYATDDRGQSLGRRSLTWFAGRTRIGRGSRVTATLPAGTVKLRLVARDRLGRTTTATRIVRVARPPLYVTTLAAPARVVPGAKTVRVRIAASARATLKVGRRSYAVGTKPRTLTLALPRSPKAGSLAVPFTVRAKGSATVKGAVRVVRV